jgi:hypothetical protein
VEGDEGREGFGGEGGVNSGYLSLNLLGLFKGRSPTLLRADEQLTKWLARTYS